MRFPDNEMLHDYKDSDFGSTVSTMLVEGMINDNYNFELGDSGEIIHLHPLIQGPAGMNNLKEDCRMVRHMLESAIPKMSGSYKEFWAFMLREYDANGVTMPHIGKIL